MTGQPMLRRAGVLLAFALGAVLLCGRSVQAQALTLSLSRTTIPFASADPDTTPSIAAPVVTVTYRVRFNGGNNWQLTLLASGDLNSGSATIAVSNVTWTATPTPPFQAGTMNATLAQRLAGGTGDVNPARTGQVAFFLANSWSYDVGTYTTSFIFTLTAP